MILTETLVFVSGVVGKDDSGAWVQGGVKEHTKAAIANARKRLQHVGLDLKDSTYFVYFQRVTLVHSTVQYIILLGE